MRHLLLISLLAFGLGCQKNVQSEAHLKNGKDSKEALVSLSERDFDKAKAYFEKAMKSNPLDYGLRNGHAYVLYKLGLTKELKDSIKTLKEMFPHNSAGWYYSYLLLSESGEGLGNDLLALKEIDNAIQRSEENGLYYLLRAETNLKLYRESSAAKDLKAFLKKNDHSTFSSVVLKNIYCKRNFSKDLLASLEELQKEFKKIARNDFLKLRTEACLSEAKGNYERAEKIYLIMLKNPRNNHPKVLGEILFALAKNYTKQKRYDEARMALDKLKQSKQGVEEKSLELLKKELDAMSNG